MAYFEYYKSLLKEEDRKHYSLLLEKIRKGEPTFTLNIPFTTRLLEVYNSIRYDHPELYFLDDNFSIYSSGKKTACKVGRIISKEESFKVAKQISEIIKKEFLPALKLNEYEKTLFVYDWFMEKVKYTKGKPNSYNIIGALIEKQCVCQGIAYASKLIFDYLKMKSIIAVGELFSEGKKEPHAWNIVFINNEPYHFDATCGLNGLHSHLNIDDNDVKKDHSFDLKKYPKCSSNKANYFVINNSLVKYNNTALEQFFRKNLTLGRTIEFKVLGAKGDIHQELLEKAAKVHFAIFSKRYNINFDVTQQVYRIIIK